MANAARERAEKKFTASQKKDTVFQEQQEKARRDKAELTAKLRALRLEKEAADKLAAKKRAAERSAKKSKTATPS